MGFFLKNKKNIYNEERTHKMMKEVKVVMANSTDYQVKRNLESSILQFTERYLTQNQTAIHTELQEKQW